MQEQFSQKTSSFDCLLRSPQIWLLAIQTKEETVVGFVRLNALDYIACKATVRLFAFNLYKYQCFLDGYN